MTSTLNGSEQCSSGHRLSNTDYLGKVRRQMNFVDPLEREGIESDDSELQQYLSGAYRSASLEERRRIRQEVAANARALEARALYGDEQPDVQEQRERKTVLERLEGYESSEKPSVLHRLEVNGRLSERGVLKYLEPEMTLAELEGCLSHAERMQSGVEPGQTGVLNLDVDNDPLPPAVGF